MCYVVMHLLMYCASRWRCFVIGNAQWALMSIVPCRCVNAISNVMRSAICFFKFSQQFLLDNLNLNTYNLHTYKFLEFLLFKNMPFCRLSKIIMKLSLDIVDFKTIHIVLEKYIYLSCYVYILFYKCIF